MKFNGPVAHQRKRYPTATLISGGIRHLPPRPPPRPSDRLDHPASESRRTGPRVISPKHAGRAMRSWSGEPYFLQLPDALKEA